MIIEKEYSRSFTTEYKTDKESGNMNMGYKSKLFCAVHRDERNN